MVRVETKSSFAEARQRAAARHRAIVHRASQHMDVLSGRICPAGIDVAFPVVHHGDGRRLRQHRLGLLAGVDPTARFLVLEPALGVRFRDPALAGVDVAADQAQAAAVVGIHRHHRMHQHAAARAFADLAQAAPPAALGCSRGGRRPAPLLPMERKWNGGGGPREAWLRGRASSQFRISSHSPIAFAFPSSHHQVPGAPTPSLGCRSGRAKASQ